MSYSSKYMKYKSAPVREAIFDLRIDNLGNSSIEDLREIHQLISDKYPDEKEQTKFFGKFKFDKGKQIKSESDSQFLGFLFSKKNNKSRVQFRLDGFTFNLLKPYSEWDQFSAEALRLWNIYNRKLKPQSVTRIALRYINKIEIPLPVDPFQEYIVNMPPIPNNLPKLYNNFFMRIEVPYDKSGTNVIVTETIEKPKNEILPFILDIDTYKIGKIGKSINNLKIEFEKLRSIKNNTFENCITDKTRELFK